MIQKYRAWNVRRWMKENEIVILPNGKFLFLVEGTENEYVEMNELDVQISYDIGLQDKNGKEIYEGDIIQTVFRGAYDNWLVEEIGSEERDGEKYGMCASMGGDGENYFIDKSILEGVIIGNIFENVELLK